MATTIQRPSDYEARSKAFAAEFAEVGLKARQYLADQCLKAAEKVGELIEADPSAEVIDGKLVLRNNPAVLNLQLKAAELTLKLNSIGADEDKKNPPIVINITNVQAAKIEQFARLEGA